MRTPLNSISTTALALDMAISNDVVSADEIRPDSPAVSPPLELRLQSVRSGSRRFSIAGTQRLDLPLVDIVAGLG